MNEQPKYQRYRNCFRTVLQAMAHPGRGYTLESDNAPPASRMLILQTLLDHEVTFCLLPDNQNSFSTAITESTGARSAPLQDADYIVITNGTATAAIKRAKKGTLAFPDASATLIICVDDNLAPTNVQLSGPGIANNTTQKPEIGGISDEDYRSLRAVNSAFPLGVDCIIITPTGRLMCIPRSSTISMAGGA